MDGFESRRSFCKERTGRCPRSLPRSRGALSVQRERHPAAGVRPVPAGPEIPITACTGPPSRGAPSPTAPAIAAGRISPSAVSLRPASTRSVRRVSPELAALRPPRHRPSRRPSGRCRPRAPIPPPPASAPPLQHQAVREGDGHIRRVVGHPGRQDEVDAPARPPRELGLAPAGDDSPVDDLIDSAQPRETSLPLVGVGQLTTPDGEGPVGYLHPAVSLRRTGPASAGSCSRPPGRRTPAAAAAGRSRR
jgi:hypothetical protein